MTVGIGLSIPIAICEMEYITYISSYTPDGMNAQNITWCMIIILWGIVNTAIIGTLSSLRSMTERSSLSDPPVNCYAGSFTGYVTIGDHEYIVSNASNDDLAHILNLDVDIVNHWPNWRDDTPLGMNFYALNTDDAPTNIDDIARECLHIMLYPDDYQQYADDLQESSLASLREATMAGLTDHLILMQQRLDATINMMNDLGIKNDTEKINELTDVFQHLRDEAMHYHDYHDADKMHTISQEIMHVEADVHQLYDETSDLHHDIASAQDSSKVISELRQKVHALRLDRQGVVG